MAAVGAFATGGCKPEADDGEAAILPKTITFEGKIDPAFVGRWSTPGDASALDLAKNGALKISSKVRTPGGVSNSEFSGRWLASGDKLLLRYAEPSGETTLEYTAKLEGNTLVLQQPGGRLKTTYKRK